MKDIKKQINEVIKIRNGKPCYAVQIQGAAQSDRMQIYINNGDVHFESSGYGWNDNAIFDICDEAHALAREMFLSSLTVAIQNRILELKQLESILDSIGLNGVVRGAIERNAPRLLSGSGYLPGKGEVVEIGLHLRTCANCTFSGKDEAKGKCLKPGGFTLLHKPMRCNDFKRCEKPQGKGINDG